MILTYCLTIFDMTRFVSFKDSFQSLRSTLLCSGRKESRFNSHRLIAHCVWPKMNTEKLVQLTPTKSRPGGAQYVICEIKPDLVLLSWAKLWPQAWFAGLLFSCLFSWSS